MSKLSPEANSARVGIFYLENIIAGQGNNAQLKLAKKLIQVALDAEERIWLEQDINMRLEYFSEMSHEQSKELSHSRLRSIYITAEAKSRGPVSAGVEKPS